MNMLFNNFSFSLLLIIIVIVILLKDNKETKKNNVSKGLTKILMYLLVILNFKKYRTDVLFFIITNSKGLFDTYKALDYQINLEML